MAVTTIQNLTPARLTLTGAGGERLLLSPLQEKALDDAAAFDFTEAEQHGLVSTGQEASGEVGTRIATVLIGGGFWAVILAWGVSAAGPYFDLTAQQWSLTVWSSAAMLLVVTVVGMVVSATRSLSLVTRFTLQLISLAVILAIGFGLPAATLYFFGGGRALLTDPGAAPLTLFGRLIQLAFIAAASLLPVLLFFLFDRFRLATLRRRLYAALFRLIPAMRTVADIDARYGAQIAEEYGSEDQGRGRLAPGSRWPVLVCAFVITIGWIIALAPVGGDFAPSSAAEALTGLVPQPTAFVFGFLGAYFFSLRLIALRYARGDLKPKAYSHIMVRLIIVAVLSWVLQAAFPGEPAGVLVLAFLFGVTPDEFFTFLKEMIRTRVLPGIKASLPSSIVPTPTTLPLTEIEGIDLYDRGRLESEGIVNIEGLAHHEFVDLIIETRIPVPRLVDWVDQAILYLHLIGGSPAGAREILRGFGIRTATDLFQTWNAAERRGAEEFGRFKRLLGGDGPPWRLEVIRDAMADDEWLAEVIAWRRNAPMDPIEQSAFPTREEALHSWADKQLDRQHYGPALATLEQALKQRDSAGTRRKIARILATSPVIELRDAERARDYARRAYYELEPEDYGSVRELIDIFDATEDVSEARRMCEVALGLVADWPNGKAKERETEWLQARQGKLEETPPPPLRVAPRGNGQPGASTAE